MMTPSIARDRARPSHVGLTRVNGTINATHPRHRFMFHQDRANENRPQEQARAQGILVGANKLIQNTSNDTRQVVRVVLVCPLINKNQESWSAELRLRVTKRLP